MFTDFRERGRGRGREKERETLIGCLPYTPLSGIGTSNLGVCPDWGSNPQPVGVLDTLQPTEPAGQGSVFFSQCPERGGRATWSSHLTAIAWVSFFPGLVVWV